jgi:hypothetical protein
MKKTSVIIQIIIIIIICVSCKCERHKRLDVPLGVSYYEGYIYTIEEQPIQGLKIYPLNCRYFRCTGADSAGVTDEQGYFKFEQATGWMSQCLIIESEGRIIDSICRTRISPRQHLGYYGFDDKNVGDTFFVDMEGKGRSFMAQQGGYRISVRDIYP